MACKHALHPASHPRQRTLQISSRQEVLFCHCVVAQACVAKSRSHLVKSCHVVVCQEPCRSGRGGSEARPLDGMHFKPPTLSTRAPEAIKSGIATLKPMTRMASMYSSTVFCRKWCMGRGKVWGLLPPPPSPPTCACMHTQSLPNYSPTSTSSPMSGSSLQQKSRVAWK